MSKAKDINFYKEIIRKSIEWHESIIPDLGKSVDEKIMEIYGQDTLYFLDIMRDAISDSKENFTKEGMEE